MFLHGEELSRLAVKDILNSFIKEGKTILIIYLPQNKSKKWGHKLRFYATDIFNIRNTPNNKKLTIANLSVLFRLIQGRRLPWKNVRIRKNRYTRKGGSDEPFPVPDDADW